MTDILDAAQINQPVEPPPEPPASPVSDSPAPPPPPIPEPPTTPPISDDLIVAPPDEVIPPEPASPAGGPPKNEPPPNEEKPKKKLRPSILITGIILLFITLPLAGYALQHSAEIRSLAGPNNSFSQGGKYNTKEGCTGSGCVNGPAVGPGGTAITAAPKAPAVTTAPVTSKAPTSGCATNDLECLRAAGSAGGVAPPPAATGAPIQTYTSEGVKAGSVIDTRNVQYYPVNTTLNSYQAGSSYATTPITNSTGGTITYVKQTKTNTILNIITTASKTIDGNIVDSTSICDANSLNCKTNNVVGGVATSTQYPTLGKVCGGVISDTCSPGLHCGAGICVFDAPAAAKAPLNFGKPCTSQNSATACGGGLTCGTGGTCVLDTTPVNQNVGGLPPSNAVVIGTCQPRSSQAPFCSGGRTVSCRASDNAFLDWKIPCPTPPKCSGDSATACSTGFIRVCMFSAVFDCVAFVGNTPTTPPSSGGGGTSGGGGGTTPVKTPTKTPTPTPKPTSAPQCISLVAYMNGNALGASDLAKLKPGDVITLALAPGGAATKARFRANGGTWKESTTKNANSQFVHDYTIISATNFTLEGEWFDGTNWH